MLYSDRIYASEGRMLIKSVLQKSVIFVTKTLNFNKMHAIDVMIYK